uniref:Uncharacterized protein n=1 Tax=Arundo donax TaxID=35708 RepID=A0A0A8YCB7_ARUDO
MWLYQEFSQKLSGGGYRK